MAQGPLDGIRVVELAGIGPAPYACMLLSDLGAEVVRVDRATPGLDLGNPEADLLRRGRRSIVLDLGTDLGRQAVLRLAESSDVLVEGFRPGVAERLGIGPRQCQERNSALVYGRMTGWGQSGPLAGAAGHDITYIALSGALAHIGREGQPPTVPLNLVGDFGGGSLFLVIGVLAALLERQRSGLGQVVDAAMVDGSASLMTMFAAMAANGSWDLSRRGVNLLDSGLPTYDCYATSDRRWVAMGPLEPKFFAEFCRLTGFEPEMGQPYDPATWPRLREQLTELFASRTRQQWQDLLEATDACVAGVLRLDEAPEHPHLVARETFVEIDNIVQPGPTPRFDRTPGQVQGPPVRPGQHTDEILEELGLG